MRVAKQLAGFPSVHIHKSSRGSSGRARAAAGLPGVREFLREIRSGGYPVLSKSCCGGVAGELRVVEIQICVKWRSCRSSGR